VQQVELWLIVAAAILVVAAAAFHIRARFARRPVVIGAVLGIVPGILGAIIVLVPRTDLVPDTFEPLLWFLIATLAGAAALLALSVGVARR
jgi:hypothetical protein